MDLLLDEMKVRVLELIPGMLGQYMEVTKVDGELKSVCVVDSSKASVDMFVVGSMGVDMMGRRVGKEGDLAGIDFILSEMGHSIKHVVTIVHDCQVFEEIPPSILSQYDLAVDIIITPSRVTRANTEHSRPSNSWWNRFKADLVDRVAEQRASDGNVDTSQDQLGSVGEGAKEVEVVGDVDIEIEGIVCEKDIQKNRDNECVETAENKEVENVLGEVELKPKQKVKRNQMNMASKFKLDNIPSSVGYPELKAKLRARDVLPGFCVITLRSGSAVVAFKEESKLVQEKLKGLEFWKTKIKMQEVLVETEKKVNVKSDIAEKKKVAEKIKIEIMLDKFQKLKEQKFSGVYLGKLPMGIGEGDIRDALEAMNLIPVTLEMGYRSRFAIAFFSEQLGDLLSSLKSMSLRGKRILVKEYRETMKSKSPRNL